MSKRPKQRESVRPAKTPRAIPIVLSGQILFSFRLFDHAPRWSDRYDERSMFHHVARKISDYESMRWNEIFVRDHLVAFSSLIRRAQDRLVELKLDDFDGLWGLRFNGLQRLWGLRWDDCFYALWWDPDHKVCPAKLKHT